ncbi:hypothetical protein [Saccharospirillum salsuginis]|uniref:Photosynthesis system II assembly factor Ycf48/Hcf136-like domain-containing protein n=1 Tax=Saccharospirillum salsuginis TaxID=418750 RepID=A0A918N804_9GAMM|nr:hypothetical protein [Saccharospirillum salsuginis]GGX46176.1 hypothetical protein GCM10007392_11550 [Saccharospirillum salsuginis]
MKILRTNPLVTAMWAAMMLVIVGGCQPSGSDDGGDTDSGDASNDSSDDSNTDGTDTGTDSGSGDTLARLDWSAENPLPGGYAFNDVIAAQGQFVAVGDSGLILVTTDGQTGSFKNVNGDYDLQAVVFNGSQYVAVGNKAYWVVDNDAADSAIFTSSDAQSWTQVDPGDIGELNDVTWTGNAFLAMGEAGKLTRSTDGSNWTVETVATTESIDALHWDSTLGFGAAGGQDVIYTSSDTTTWTEQSTSTVFEFVSNGSRMIGLGGIGLIYSSTDGVNWESDFSGNGTISTMRGADWSGTDLVVGDQNGDIGVRTPGDWSGSTDHWSSTASGVNESLNGLAYLNGTYLSVGDGSAMLTATDPSSWTLHSSDIVGGVDLNGIDGNGSGVTVAVGDSGWIATADSASSPWTAQQLTAQAQNLNDVVWTGTQFAATGRSQASGSSITEDSIVILTSPDGHTWNEFIVDGSALGDARVAGHDGIVAAVSPTGHVAVCDTSCTETDLNSLPRNIEWAGDRFIVVGDAGLFKTSADGQSWSNGNSPTGNGMQAMAYGNGTLVVGQNIANTNKVFVTTDLSTWETVEVTDPDWSNLRWLRYEDGEFVGGTNGFLWTSPDGKQWSKTALPHQTWDGTAKGSGYLVVGNDGRIMHGD